MFIKSTTYFGDVKVEIHSEQTFEKCYANFWAVYNHQRILVSIFEYNLMGNKLLSCWDIVNTYPEINKIAQKAMIKNFSIKNSEVNKFFKYYFDKYSVNEQLIKEIFGVNDFEKIDIKTLVEQLSYPDLDFNFEDDIWTFCVDYGFLESYFDDDLRFEVSLNEKKEVIDFEIYQ